MCPLSPRHPICGFWFYIGALRFFTGRLLFFVCASHTLRSLCSMDFFLFLS